MKKIETLVNDFFEYTKTISIGEPELYENYCDKINSNYLDSFDVEKAVKQDILYDFIFNIENIKEQLQNDFYSYDEESEEMKYILHMYNKIKNIFDDFYIKELEEQKENDELYKKEIIYQLKDLREDAKSKITDDDNDIFKKDIEALNYAINYLSSL